MRIFTDLYLIICSKVISTCSCVECDCTSISMELYGISDKDLNEMTNDEKAYLNKLYQIYYFIQEKIDISDWSTKNIGTFFVQTIMETINSNEYYEIDDIFTHQIGNVSWPDIAMMYNLKDFRILTEFGNKLSTPARYKDPEPCDVLDLSCSSSLIERYSPFQSCFKDQVSDNYQSDEDTIFRKEDKMEKAIQSSPCQRTFLDQSFVGLLVYFHFCICL